MALSSADVVTRKGCSMQWSGGAWIHGFENEKHCTTGFDRFKNCEVATSGKLKSASDLQRIKKRDRFAFQLHQLYQTQRVKPRGMALRPQAAPPGVVLWIATEPYRPTRFTIAAFARRAWRYLSAGGTPLSKTPAQSPKRSRSLENPWTSYSMPQPILRKT